MTTSAEKLREFFPLFDLPLSRQRFNIAPTQLVASLRQVEAGAKPQAAFLRWGLIPSWAKDKKIGYQLINARAESVSEKPSFRNAFRKRRCLILADGFFEWQKLDDGKQPYHIRFQDGRPFAFAGLWEHWEGEDPAVDSCTIITTQANEMMQSLHERMPVILEPQLHSRWLDPGPKDPAMLQELLRPYPGRDLLAVPISQRVNNVRNDDAEVLQ